METKNVIAAVSLSALIIVLYSLFFAPPPSKIDAQKNNITKKEKQLNETSPTIENKSESKKYLELKLLK